MNKSTLRTVYKQIRKNLSSEIRSIASKKAQEVLYKISKNFDLIFSFMPKEEEIDLLPLNEKLATEGKLCLPLVSENHLDFFQVNSLRNLVRSSLGIYEPSPHKCTKIKPTNSTCVLVPGIAFDLYGARLGYGKGFYDSYLPIYPGIKVIGVGFQQQLVFSKMIQEKTDYPILTTFLF